LKRFIKSCGILTILIFLFFPLFAHTPAQAAPKEYLPGDFVQLVVDSPADTAQISATMPDNTIINLVHERRSTLWRGIWEIPVDFRQGTFTAKLQAVDLEGNLFAGESDTFTIMPLSMIMLVGKGSKEAAAVKTPLAEKITKEGVPAGIPQAELLNEIRKLFPQSMARPAPAMNASEKALLIESNMIAGKDNQKNGRLAEAISNFRIVLFLDPANQEANKYLGETQISLANAQAVRRQQMMLIIAGGIAALLILIILIILIVGAIQRALAPSAPCPPAPRTDKEKRDQWYGRTGWKSNPFSPDIFKLVFIGNNPLEINGFKRFIISRIESVGGKGLAPFTDSAIDQIFAYSKGKPKEALKICDWAVSQSINVSAENISAEIIKDYELVGFKTILIADDEEDVRATLDVILKKGGGYHTDFAVDGEEAMKKIRENLYGLVLLDLVMPKIDGYEILRQTRAIYPDLPVVFVTGTGIPKKVLDSFTENDLSGYIAKPFTPERVLDIVAKALKSR
jgi:CheY-like chemotaxis protein